ncbi:MAG: DUF1616 domain-containing protein [Candidatus Bathyarchaeota archaeon]|nr:DUF1616 domain-containing protein [Candidatus Bathyarchaeum sp.]
MKTHQSKFMEKRIKKTSQGTESTSGDNEEKTIILTILVSIVIIGALLVNLIFFTPATTEPFSAIYVLDSEKQTANLPKTVVLGENSTFMLWVGVENQNDTTMKYQVQVKMDDGNGQLNQSLAELIQSFENTLLDEEVWEFNVTINIDQLGNNRIIFELMTFNNTINDWQYTGNWVNISVEATQATSINANEQQKGT